MAKKKDSPLRSRARPQTAASTALAVPDEVLPPTGISTSVQITKEDVLAIASSRAEQLCRGNIKRLEAELAAGSKRLAEITKEVELLCEEDATRYLDAGHSLCSTLTLWYPKNLLQAKTSAYAIDLSGNSPSYHAKLAVYLTDSNREVISLTKQHKLSAEINPYIEERQIILDRTAEAQQEILAWRKRLQNMPLLERQYRGKIAEQQLVRTEEGQAMLAAIQERIAEDLLELG